MAGIIEVNENNYKDYIKEGFAILDIYGDNCGPCEMLAKVFETMIFDFPFLNILKLNIDKNKKFQNDFKITGVPKVIFFKDGKEVYNFLGFRPAKEIMEEAKKYLY